MNKKSNEGLTVKKEDFSEWFSQVIEKAEIVDLRLGLKGFIVKRAWGTRIIEKMYQLYEEELQKNKHQPVIMPSLIPESNLKKESEHVEGFNPEVFWLESQKGEERLALRPTSETLFTPMFKLWIRSHRDLPMKIYQKGSVFRLDTKATRPLIREREFQWIEAHDAFGTKEEAEKQVQEDIETTEKVMHQKFGIPFLPLKRPIWDKFAGAEYTIGSDVIMPDGKLIQQPSTHLMGQKFSKAFNAKFVDEKGNEEYLWTTAYGPAISRILVSVISVHGDNKGLVIPSLISPIQIIIIPIYKKENKEKIIKYAQKILNKLEGYRVEIDDRDFNTPGRKFNEWELKGVPFRIEVGEEELKKESITFFIRDIRKREQILLRDLSKIKLYEKEYNKRIINNADKFLESRIKECKTIDEIKKSIKEGKIVKTSFCSIEKEGLNCAEKIEKETGAGIRGILANKKELPKGKCIICKKDAKEVVYIGKSY
ncbi:proline--tRNA ligase [Patescibacteria group bacterium]|nr:proline--tRNA ligase [Patescibacteria group bacterium]